MGCASNVAMIAGALLIFRGIIGLTIPALATHQMDDVAKIVEVSLQTPEEPSHAIPSLLSGGSLILGAILFAGGGLRR